VEPPEVVTIFTFKRFLHSFLHEAVDNPQIMTIWSMVITTVRATPITVFPKNFLQVHEGVQKQNRFLASLFGDSISMGVWPTDYC
jgi:hypothetical protein